jgi:hypothetical protein
VAADVAVRSRRGGVGAVEMEMEVRNVRGVASWYYNSSTMVSTS